MNGGHRNTNCAVVSGEFFDAVGCRKGERQAIFIVFAVLLKSNSFNSVFSKDKKLESRTCPIYDSIIGDAAAYSLDFRLRYGVLCEHVSELQPNNWKS